MNYTRHEVHGERTDNIMVGRRHLGNLGVDGRIILKWTLEN
jgi:hypothetical protein